MGGLTYTMKCELHDDYNCKKGRCRFRKQYTEPQRPDNSATATQILDLFTGTFIPVDSFEEGAASY